MNPRATWIGRLADMGFSDEQAAAMLDAAERVEATPPRIMDGVDRIASERIRQVREEGWTTEHDDEHADESLAMVAAWYAAPETIFVHGTRRVQVNASRGIDQDVYRYEVRDVSGIWEAWPESWDRAWDKREKHDRIRQLEIAGALIAAEIDRLLRQEGDPHGGS